MSWRNILKSSLLTGFNTGIKRKEKGKDEPALAKLSLIMISTESYSCTMLFICRLGLVDTILEKLILRSFSAIGLRTECEHGTQCTHWNHYMRPGNIFVCALCRSSPKDQNREPAHQGKGVFLVPNFAFHWILEGWNVGWGCSNEHEPRT